MIASSSHEAAEAAASGNMDHYSSTQSHNLFKRSKVMKSHSFVRAAVKVAAALLVLVGLSFGQGILKNGGTFTNTGTATYNSIQNYKTNGGTIINGGTMSATAGALTNHDGVSKIGSVRNYGTSTHGVFNVATNLDNNLAGALFDNDSNAIAGAGVLRVGGAITNAGTFDTDSGEVDYNGSGAQSILALIYGSLKTDTGGTKTMTGTVVVRDTFRIGNGTTFTTFATSDSLAVLATTQSSAGTFSPLLGAVNYGANANQTVFGGTYQRLYLSNSSSAHSKVTTSGLAFAASGLLNVGANDTLEVTGGNLNLAGNSPTFTNGWAVKVQANATFNSGISNAGTFYYASNGAQTIGSVTYTNLLLEDEGVKSLPDEDTVWVLGNYTIVGSGAGSRDYDSSSAVSALAFVGTGGSQTISGLDGEHMNIVHFEGSSTKALNGTFVEARKLTLAAGGLVTNNATTLRLSNIAGISMSLATSSSLTNSATKTITMNGDLENDGSITNAGTISVY